MDPWMMGLLSMFAAQNPGKAGPMLDQLGIPPPSGDMMKLGGPGHPAENFIPYTPPPVGSNLPKLQAPPVPGFPTQFPPEAPPEGNPPVIPPFETAVNPAPAGLGGPDYWDSLVAQAQANPTGAQPPDPNAAANAQAKALMGLAGLQGIKPPAPITPIMGGGVAGGVKPPDTSKSLQAGSPAINALMAALLGGGNQNPLRVPTLGSLIHGR